MPRSLTLEQLADETGTGQGLLSNLTEIGVLKPVSDEVYQPGDIIRVEAARSLLDAGLSIGDIATALGSGLFTFDYLDRYHPEPAPRSGQTLAAFAASLNVDLALMGSMYLAMGLPEPRPEYVLRQDEEMILREFVALWDIDDEALLRAARLIGEPTRMVTDGWSRLFVEKFSAPLSAGDLPPSEQIVIIADTTERAALLVPRMLQWLLQRHMRHAIDTLNVEGFEQTMSGLGLALPVPARLPAIAFVDVSGYTSMTETEGDELALRASETIRERALRSSRDHGGSVVKILGDAAMLHFADVRDALVAVTELVESVTREWLPIHAGIHAGSLIEHDGDYYGRTVNLASRVAGTAGPGQVVVTQAVVDATEAGMFTFDPLTPVSLKGIAQPVTLYRVSVAS